MSKYEIRDVVSDYGIYKDGELLLILNSRSNAEYIKAILEVDGCLPNAATVYSPKVEAMSDEECLAVFRLCCEKGYNCEKCPFFDTDACCQLHIDRRVLAMAERACDAVEIVPKSEYDELKAMLDAAVAGQETLQEALAEAKSEVAAEIFENVKEAAQFVADTYGKRVDEETDFYLQNILRASQIGALTLLNTIAIYEQQLKKKYTEGKTDENISD